MPNHQRKVVAAETPFEAEFNELARQIVAGTALENQEIGWLSEFMMDQFSGDLDDVVYSFESLQGEFFTDENLLDRRFDEDLPQVADSDRVRHGREFLDTLGETDLDTFSMFDPAILEFVLESDIDSAVNVVVGFCCLGGHGVMAYYFLFGYQNDDFHAELKRVGYMTADELREVTDDWILDHWYQPDRGK